MNKKSVRDIDVAGKRVLVREDFNVPLDKNGVISDDTRIREALPTIRYMLKHKAIVMLCSHLGRPDGKVVEELRLRPVARRLSELLGLPVVTTRDCIGPEVAAATETLKPGEVLLLENLRFHGEEEKNDPTFAQALARLADVFVNDAFGTTHRAHASTVGVTNYLPAVAGFLVEKEIGIMGKALDNPERPLALVIGGAKVSDKIAVLENILGKVDSLLIGGGMACTFLKAKGYDVGSSLLEADRLDFARNLMRRAKDRGGHLLLPVDAVVASNLKGGAQTNIVPISQVPAGWGIGDIGPKTVELFRSELQRCRTVIWNGPMGIFELPEFAQGTKELARTLASLKQAITIIGGGSTAEAVVELGLESKMTHVSTGGGASLQFLEGTALPGVAALLDKEAR